MSENKTREGYLNSAALWMAPEFEALGAALPRFRVSIGFTSMGASKRVLAECWTDTASADRHHEIFISPSQAESERVLDILTHELVHAAVGIDKGHGPVFGQVARALGLEGPLPATFGGERFRQWIKPLLDELGPIPHGKLNESLARRTDSQMDPRLTTRPKKQSTRLVKVACRQCGYVCRVTRKWIRDAGPPICPTHNQAMHTSE